MPEGCGLLRARATRRVRSRKRWALFRDCKRLSEHFSSSSVPPIVSIEVAKKRQCLYTRNFCLLTVRN